MVAKIGSLVDKFAYVSIDPAKWETIGDPIVTNKRLKLETGQGIKSRAEYDFTGSQAFAIVDVALVHALEDTGEAGADFQFTFEVDSTNNISMRLLGDYLHFSITKNGIVNGASIVYQPDAHAQWRMRERYGVLIWETSNSGVNWDIQRQLTHGMNLTHGKLLLLNQAASTCGVFGAGLFGAGVFGCVPV